MTFQGPILIAGAGPVGLVAAARLTAAGFPVVMFEKRDGINRASRASTFHPPTLEILDELGILPSLLPHGLRVNTLQFRDAHGVQASLDLGTLHRRTRFPFRFHLEQAVVSQHLLSTLEDREHFTLLLRAEVLDVESLKDRVRVTYMDPRSREPTPFDGSVLLGADGATGRVRESLGIEMPGKDYASPALRIFFQRDLRHYVCDLAPVTYLFSGGRSCSLLQMAGGWRAILRLSEHTSDEVALARPFQLAELQGFLPVDASAFENTSADIYRSSHRVAVRNQQGRVFLIGDAAHLTNTRGGMNMNCGIHDADAISRSLTRSLRENQPERVLACAQERLRVAHELLVPRTDTSVASPEAWFNTVRELSSDPMKSLAYLHQASMLDMV